MKVLDLFEAALRDVQQSPHGSSRRSFRNIIHLLREGCTYAKLLLESKWFSSRRFRSSGTRDSLRHGLVFLSLNCKDH